MIINESASEAKMIHGDSSYNLASQVSLNIKGEFDAIEGYDKLIPWFEKNHDKESINIVREIISDEKNHVELLKKVLSKYDHDIEIAKD